MKILNDERGAALAVYSGSVQETALADFETRQNPGQMKTLKKEGLDILLVVRPDLAAALTRIYDQGLGDHFHQFLRALVGYKPNAATSIEYRLSKPFEGEIVSRLGIMLGEEFVSRKVGGEVQRKRGKK